MWCPCIFTVTILSDGLWYLSKCSMETAYFYDYYFWLKCPTPCSGTAGLTRKFSHILLTQVEGGGGNHWTKPWKKHALINYVDYSFKPQWYCLLFSQAWIYFRGYMRFHILYAHDFLMRVQEGNKLGAWCVVVGYNVWCIRIRYVHFCTWYERKKGWATPCTSVGILAKNLAFSIFKLRC